MERTGCGGDKRWLASYLLPQSHGPVNVTSRWCGYCRGSPLSRGGQGSHCRLPMARLLAVRDSDFKYVFRNLVNPAESSVSTWRHPCRAAWSW